MRIGAGSDEVPPTEGVGGRRGALVGQMKDYQGVVAERSRRLRSRRAPDGEQSSSGSVEGGSFVADGADGPFPDGEEIDESTWALAFALAMFCVGTWISDRTDGVRGEKMARVLARQADGLTVLLDDAGLGEGDVDEVFHSLVDSWSEGDRIRFLIDLDFSDPFFPYDLKVRPQDFQTGLREVARSLGFERDVVGEISEARRSALRAHQSVSWAKIGLFGAGGVVLLGTGAYLLAPLVGAALGASAGLSGAAAVSHGLALLGGGTLASGGAGMAGGMWLVAGTGAATGLVAGSGSAAFFEMGASQARAELTRLQVTFKMTLLAGQVDTLKAQKAIASLHAQLDVLGATLAEERLLNDENSDRVKDLEAKISAIEETLTWMSEQQAATA